MFLETSELTTAIAEYTLNGITTDDTVKRVAILAAMEEITSYLAGKYDTTAIFSAQGDNRNILIMEHCKSIAVMYIIRRSNADIVFEKAKIYYDSAIDWLEKVSGVHVSGKTISPDLPIKKDASGETITKMRMGSNRKFNHHFGD